MNIFRGILYVVFSAVFSMACTDANRVSGNFSEENNLRDSAYLPYALEAAKWIQRSAVLTEAGTLWYAVPGDSSSSRPNLYYGSPGIVLFYLELFAATGDSSFLNTAVSGADHLLRTMENLPPDMAAQKAIFGTDSDGPAGLYSGLAGVGYTLGEAYRISGHNKYHDGVAQCIRALVSWATERDGILSWGDVTDVISGDAGIGLFLLYAYDRLGIEEGSALAKKMGRGLIQKALPAGNGLKWAMDPGFPRLMPNFSHGTAGICYFLARLWESTHDTSFLNTALMGAAYLEAVTDPGTGLIFHHEPDGEDIFYLGWCHGPAGTSRLYYKLWQITKNQKWLEMTDKAAAGVMASGIPDSLTPGFWNNEGQCCGTASVGEFFTVLGAIRNSQPYSAFAGEMTSRLIGKAIHEGGGIKWVHAENNKDRDVLSSKTGYMTGAAGIGMYFLHLDAIANRRKPAICLPDNPFNDAMNLH